MVCFAPSKSEPQIINKKVLVIRSLTNLVVGENDCLGLMSNIQKVIDVPGVKHLFAPETGVTPSVNSGITVNITGHLPDALQNALTKPTAP